MRPYMQVKAYVRVHGPPEETDKGYVSISYNDHVTDLYYSHTLAHVFRVSLLCAFVFLNILTPVVLAKSTPWYYSKIREKTSCGDFVGCLYWATALTTIIYNVGYTANSFWNHFGKNLPTITSCVIHLSNQHSECTIPARTTVYKDEVITLVAKVTIIPVAVFIELLISVYTVRHQFIAVRIQYDHGYHYWKLYLLQSLHVLALWNILITIQLATMTVIPLTVLLLVHPQETILLLIFFVMVLVGLTLIAAYVVYQCQEPRRKKICCNGRHCGRRFVHFVSIIAVLGLVIELLVLYELMLFVQVQIDTGVKGIVLSLLPSFPLSALGWYLKRRLQRRAAADADEKQFQLLTREQQIQNTNGNSDEEPLLL